jgi:hypothetical protein
VPRPRQNLVPREVAFLGELGSCVLHNPRTASFFAWPYQPGRILVLGPDERNMYVLRPTLTGQRVHPSAIAVAAMGIHERFTHRAGDGFYNCVIPPVRRPKFAGELVIIRYSVDKDIPGVDDGRTTEWEHYFEEPGVAPAYPELWDIGHGQFIIPPGPWRVRPEGIVFGSDPSGRRASLLDEMAA